MCWRPFVRTARSSPPPAARWSNNFPKESAITELRRPETSWLKLSTSSLRVAFRLFWQCCPALLLSLFQDEDLSVFRSMAGAKSLLPSEALCRHFMLQDAAEQMDLLGFAQFLPAHLPAPRLAKAVGLEL